MVQVAETNSRAHCQNCVHLQFGSHMLWNMTWWFTRSQNYFIFVVNIMFHGGRQMLCFSSSVVSTAEAWCLNSCGLICTL